MNKQTEQHDQHDVTLKEVCLDVLISSALITGAWFTSELGNLFFPEGIPLSDSLLIYARTVISILWAVRMVVRYSVSTFKEINAAIVDLLDTEVWKKSQGAIVSTLRYLWKSWQNMDSLPRYLIIVIFVVGLSLALFMLTESSVDLWLPPTYGATALLLAYLFERENLVQNRGIRRYWVMVFAFFCIIQICIGIGVIDLLALAETNLFVELWEFILQLPHTQLSPGNNLRILVSMSTMYLLAHNIYQRNEADLVLCSDNLKKRLHELSSSYQKLPVLSMA